MKFANYEREIFFSRLIWLFPIAYVFHITEEAPGFAAWVTHVLGGQMETKAFYINNAAFMAILLTLCFLANRVRKPWSTILLFLWVSAQEFWNFVFHVYAEFQFSAYSPGYFTAIFLYFPIYAYLTYLALREEFLTWGQWILCFVISSFGMFFTIWAGLYHFSPIPWNRWIGWNITEISAAVPPFPFSMNRLLIVAASLSAPMFFAAASGDEPAAGFTALFNGHDLSGWQEPTMASKHWKVANDELVNDGQGADLVTAKSFRDFELTSSLHVLLDSIVVSDGANGGRISHRSNFRGVNDGRSWSNDAMAARDRGSLRHGRCLRHNGRFRGTGREKHQRAYGSGPCDKG